MKPIFLPYALRSAVAILFLAGLAACQTVQTTQGGTVGVERSQRMAPSLSASQFDQAAGLQYGKMIGEQNSKGRLNRDPVQVARVRAIAARLAAQVGAFRVDALQWKWEVNVLTDEQINAWCMPGGKIAVYTGLLDKLKLSDAEVAAVLGHEIAHALREHSRERASEQRVAAVGITLATAALGLGNLGQQGMEYAYQGLLGLPNSRLHETEADRIGIELAARAGYDPQAAISLWRKMAGQAQGAPIAFLSTHPSQESRIADLTVYAAKVMPLYRDSPAAR